MANCQNNMRYNRTGNMYQQYSSCMNPRQMPIQRGNECRCESHSAQRRGSGGHRDELADMPLAMAYVPWQKWCEIYDICEGFRRGTIFRELDKPFLGRGGCNR